MTKKIFNSDLETSGSVTVGGSVTATTLICPATSGNLRVNGTLTSDDLTCEGDLVANTATSNQGYLTQDKTDSTTDRLLRHTPSVYAREELTASVSGIDFPATVQSLDTLPATFHANLGSVNAFNDYGHSAITLRSDIVSDASTEADYFTIPTAQIRSVALDSNAASALSSTGVVLIAQVGKYMGSGLDAPSHYTQLHVRPDLVKVTGDMQVTGTFTNFTGSHTLPVDQQTLASLTPGMCLVLGSDGSVTLSSSPNSSTAVGIFVSSATLAPASEDTPGDTNSYGEYSEFTAKVAAVGDTRVGSCQGFNVCNENGDIQPGDLLVTSSTPGYLMKQDDDIMRSKTVGKAMEAVTFDDNGQATGVYGFIYCG